MNDLESLLEKIKKIETLIEKTKIDGEKKAALQAKERILEKYPKLKINQNAKEYALYTQGAWHKRLLLALCAKYGVRPYRYHRQKYTTVMVNINEGFLNKVLWKEYLEYSKLLEDLVDEVTGNLIRKIHGYEEEDIIHGKVE